MEKECIQSIQSLKGRLTAIMKQGHDLPKSFHSLELCLVCQTVDHIKDDLIWHLENGTKNDTKCSMIFQRTDTSDSCHHVFSSIPYELIKMSPPCSETIEIWIEPRVEVACFKRLQVLCDTIDILLEHNSSISTKTSHYVCLCRVFDNMNLYLTRSEKYISELNEHQSPREKLIKLLGGKWGPCLAGHAEQRWRDNRGRLCYLSDNETVVTDLVERMIYLSFYPNKVPIAPDDAIVIKKADNDEIIYTVATPDFGKNAMVANYSFAYNVTRKKWLADDPANPSYQQSPRYLS